MTTTISIRVDAGTERELAELTAGGMSRNAAIVSAIHEAYRQAVLERVRRESAALRDDPGYQAEIKAIGAVMGEDGDAW